MAHPLLRAMYRAYRGVRAAVEFRREFTAFARLSEQTPHRFELKWADRQPCLEDRTPTTFDRHYVYHTAWAARVLAQTRPATHVDFSSSLYFGAIVSAFVPITFYDYRLTPLQLNNLSVDRADLTRLPFAEHSLRSLSCMHVVEHIGLGRYGDPLDPEGDLKAMSELQRVVAPGGQLLLVTPVGRSIIRFNAHRIYAYRQVIRRFPELSLRQFALIPDDDRTGPIEPATEAEADQQAYGCGCFWFQRPGPS